MSFNLISLYIVIVILLRHQINIFMQAKISSYQSLKSARNNRINAYHGNTKKVLMVIWISKSNNEFRLMKIQLIRKKLQK